MVRADQERYFSYLRESLVASIVCLDALYVYRGGVYLLVIPLGVLWIGILGLLMLVKMAFSFNSSFTEIMRVE